jgi:hypothetical protein
MLQINCAMTKRLEGGMPGDIMAGDIMAGDITSVGHNILRDKTS